MDTIQTNPNLTNPDQVENQIPVINQAIPVQPENGMSQDTKTIIVVMLLIMVYPIGVIMMFAWMKKWPWWVKLLAMVPTTLIFIAFLGIISTAMISTINPSAQMDKAKDAVMKNNAAELVNATENYYASFATYPWGSEKIYQSVDVGKERWLAELVDKGEIRASSIEEIKKNGTMSLSADLNGVKVCFQEKVPTKNTICVPEE